ncbi:hypothetical protein D3C80_1930040 [compost metagenome]
MSKNNPLQAGGGFACFLNGLNQGFILVEHAGVNQRQSVFVFKQYRMHVGFSQRYSKHNNIRSDLHG